MIWTTPKELKAQLTRLWERGELLRDMVTGHARFPLTWTIKGPSSTDVTNRFETVRIWVAELANASPLRLQWQEVRHRVYGLQSLPSSACIESMEDVLDWLGKRHEGDQFVTLVEMTRRDCPALLPWLEKRPLQALSLLDNWPGLLAVVRWLKKNPRPGIYPRQVDLPGVHSKFIESHRTVLTELLDLALPIERVNTTRAGVGKFAARYGFREKPTRIRFRILDPQIQAIPGTSCPDIALDADSFSRMTLDVRQVFITGNETNFLALPNIPGAMAIFGSGYGWDALAKARWLESCAIHYWGDIDTHGFAILNQLRGHFSHVTSLLMDKTTLEAHAHFWGLEDKPQRANLHRLTPDELDLYDLLRDNHIREGLRLEQEHLGFGWIRERLDRLQHKTF